MTDDLLPPKLMSRCLNYVVVFHKKVGFGNLPVKVTTKQNMVTLAHVVIRWPKARPAMQGASVAFKLRILCWLLGIVLVVLAWGFGWWILLGLVAILIADRKLSAHQRNSWMFQAAILLGLEVLAEDFAGWGTAYPSERAEALNITRQNAPQAPASWLDFYFPSRFQVAPEVLKQLGPE